MRPIIEFCTNNMHHGTEKIMKQLEQNQDYDVIEYGCLGRCGECFMMPFAIVNGDFVSAENMDELNNLIVEKINQADDFFNLFDEEEED